MAPAIPQKLQAARARLVMGHPFLGALVLRLQIQPGNPPWCRTTATDARTFFFNPEYIESLTLAETQFALAHEALHCALAHFYRRRHRDPHRWDLACDFAINPTLVAEGLRAPPGVLALEMFSGMTAEEIYPLLDDFENEEPHDQHLYDHSDQTADQPGTVNAAQPEESNPIEPHDISLNPLNHAELEQLAQEWQRHAAAAAQHARESGRLGGHLQRLFKSIHRPTLPWRMLLARYLVSSGREDYRYTRASRREGAAILPGRQSHQLDLFVAIDTSGSISDEELRSFADELNALKAQVSARVTLVGCDSELNLRPTTCETWEPLEIPAVLTGGGGTSFVPVFAWADGIDIRPDLLLYFTDGLGEFPDAAPEYPVTWLIKGNASVPWGERIQLN